MASGSELAARGTKHVTRTLELSAPPPDLLGGERGWGLSQSPTANAVIGHRFIRKLL